MRAWLQNNYDLRRCGTRPVAAGLLSLPGVCARPGRHVRSAEFRQVLAGGPCRGVRRGRAYNVRRSSWGDHARRERVVQRLDNAGNAGRWIDPGRIYGERRFPAGLEPSRSPGGSLSTTHGPLIGSDPQVAERGSPQGCAGGVMNRRDFVLNGTAAAAGIGVAGFAAADVPGGARVAAVHGPPPYKVIFDARFQACRSFADGAARLGCTLQPVRGDVTAVWFNDLQPRWVQRKETVVGMTTVASLLCLEQLAWDQWMRVVARVEHRPRARWNGPPSAVPARARIAGSTPGTGGACTLG